METNDFGFPLDWSTITGEKIFPLAALIVVKGVNSDGEEVYSCLPTEGLSDIDALGMVHFATLHVENAMRKSLAEQDT